MVIGLECFTCHETIINGFPKEDDEPQFCSKKCQDKYIKEHKELPIGMIKQY
jgi:hypothetical protein